MNLGKFASSLVCDSRIDDDVSTTNNTSRLRLAMIGAVTVAWSGTGAHAASPATSTNTAPARPQATHPMPTMMPQRCKFRV